MEEKMATHSGILTWRILWTEELGGLQYIGSQRSDMTEQLSTHAAKSQVFLKRGRRVRVSSGRNVTMEASDWTDVKKGP